MMIASCRSLTGLTGHSVPVIPSHRAPFGVPVRLLIGFLVAAALPAAGQTPQPAKEYIRLGGRVIAIENQGPPPLPTELTATGGDAQVLLSWGTSAGATSYNVYRGTTAGGESTTAIATGIATAAYTNTGLTNGTTYYYRVAAVNASGTSGLSVEASATPQAGPPPPAWLTATAGDAQVGLSWAVSAGATSYNVYRGTTAGGESTTAVATGIAITTYTDASLINGTTYYYKVAAVNASGTSGLSVEASATPQAGPPPPAWLTATAGDAQVGLSWAVSVGATSYNVYRGTTAGGESTTAIATGIAPAAYTNTGLTNGTTYYYKVAAVNASGTSGLSGEASATPQVGSPPPPAGLTATAGNAQVGLSWAVSAGATSYNVYRGTTAGGESTTAIATGIAIPTYTDAGLTNGTTYYYKVKAVNASGTSGFSGEASATPQAGPPPPPTGLTATAGNAYVMLSWTASPGAAAYNVYRGTTAGGESPVPIATGIASTGYVDSLLTNGTTYYYKVKAVNGGGTSDFSGEAWATPPGAPPPPTGLTATAGNAQVVLNWTASSGATSYNVYRGTSPGGESPTAIATGIPTTTYTNTGLTNGTTYYYKVAAVNAGGTSAQSNEAWATPSSMPTDLVLQNLTLSSGVSLYQAHNSITAQNGFIVNGSAAVTFQAGSIIRLESGFQATAGTAGTTFHAFIDPSIR